MCSSCQCRQQRVQETGNNPIISIKDFIFTLTKLSEPSRSVYKQRYIKPPYAFVKILVHTNCTRPPIVQLAILIFEI